MYFWWKSADVLNSDIILKKKKRKIDSLMDITEGEDDSRNRPFQTFFRFSIFVECLSNIRLTDFCKSVISIWKKLWLTDKAQVIHFPYRHFKFHSSNDERHSKSFFPSN